MQVVSRIVEFRRLQYVCGGNSRNIAALLLDRATDELLFRFADLSGLKDQELEILSAIHGELYAKAQELGACALVDHFIAAFSAVTRLTAPQEIVANDMNAEFEKLWAEHLGQNEGRITTIDSRHGVTPIFSKTRFVVAVSLEAVRYAAEIPSAWSKSLRRIQVALSIASAASILMVLFIGTHLIEVRNSGALEPPRTLSSVKTEDANTNLLSIAPPDTLISARKFDPAAVAGRRPRARRLIRKAALKAFSEPEKQGTTLSDVILSPLPYTVKPTPPSTSVINNATLTLRVLPPAQKERANRLRRFAQVVSYPFRKVGSAFRKALPHST